MNDKELTERAFETEKRTGLGFRDRVNMARGRRSTGYGDCSRCLLTWDVVDGHTIAYATGCGCFPICNECWDELTPVERVPFYLAWLVQTDTNIERDGLGDECERYNTLERRTTLEANVLANRQIYFDELSTKNSDA
jgi:hypothetical protein